MMEVMPMPCCGTEPHDAEGNMMGGWDPRTGLCRHCGKDGLAYDCQSPTCRGSTREFEQFCEGCQGAFELGLIEDTGPWYPDPAGSGPRHRAFPSPGYQLIAYEDGRWAVRYRGDTIGSGMVIHVGDAVLHVGQVLCRGIWKQHSRTHIKTTDQHFVELMAWRKRMAEHHPECKDAPDGLDIYAGCHPNCPGLAALMEYTERHG